jgi:hypothetical protein
MVIVQKSLLHNHLQLVSGNELLGGKSATPAKLQIGSENYINFPHSLNSVV